MILNVKKNNETNEEEYKNANENNYSFIDNLKYYFYRYKLFIGLFIIILAIIFMLSFFSKEETKTGEMNIKVADNSIFYVSESNKYIIKFEGVNKLSKDKYDINVWDPSIIKIQKDEVISNDLVLNLKPYNVGKTDLYIEVKDGDKKVDKNINLVVCKKLSASNLSSNIIHMNSNVSSKMLFDVGYLSECQNDVKIESSDSDILKIENNSIKSLKEGKVYLTLKQNNDEIKLNVNVSNDIKLVEDILIDSEKINIKIGKKYKIPYKVEPAESDNKYLIWESSDNDVVNVNQNGLVESVGYGSAVITVTSVDGSNINKKINIEVSNDGTIKEVVKEIKFENEVLTIDKGGAVKINYKLLPANVDYQSIDFSSSNNKIVTVDQNGIVSGIKEGQAYVTIKVKNLDNSEIKAKMKINVNAKTVKYVNVEKIKIEVEPFLDWGKTYKLNYSVTPSNANIKSVSIKSTNPNSVSITNNGVLTAKDVGEPQLIVTITNMDGTKVEEKTRVMVRSGVSLTAESPTNIKTNGADFSCNITNRYNRTINEAGIYIWKSTSSEPKSPTYKTTSVTSGLKKISFPSKTLNLKLTSNTNYKFKFYIKIGTNVYYSPSKEFKTSKQITTTQPVETSISFKRAYAAVAVGDSYSLPINISPSNSKPTYKSANTSIATVGSDGIIKGIKTGETVVTATLGGKSATIKVRVVGAASKNSPAMVYDFSEYNTVSSWSTMKSKGINYLILRLGITRSSDWKTPAPDDKFDEFVKGARENNIEIGVYYYSRAKTTDVAKTEANYVLNKLNSYSPGTFSMPVYIDFEESGLSFDKNGVNIINTFCDVIQAGGYYCGAYTYYQMYSYGMGKSVKSYWVPDWTCGGSYAKGVTNLGMWQFAAPDSSSCQDAEAYGVDFADNNYLYVNYATEIINSGFNNFK